MPATQKIQITAFGETHEVECYVRPEGVRIDTVKAVAVGKFPTGTKLHKSPLTLWKRDRGYHSVTGAKLRDLRGDTAAIIDGVEYVADMTLYTHNRNSGRLIAWDAETFAPAIAQWNGGWA